MTCHKQLLLVRAGGVRWAMPRLFSVQECSRTHCVSAPHRLASPSSSAAGSAPKQLVLPSTRRASSSSLPEAPQMFSQIAAKCAGTV